MRHAPRASPLQAAGVGALVGAVAGVVAGALEVGMVLGSGRSLFVSTAEPARFAGIVVSLVGGGSAVAGIAVGLVAWASTRVVSWLGGGPRAIGRVAGTVALPFLAWTALLAVSGSGIRRVPGRLVLAALGTFVCTIVVGFVARWLAAALRGPTRRRLLAALLFGFTGVGLALLDRHLLPRLYGWLHTWLGLGSVASFALVFLLLLGPVHRSARWLALAGAAATLGTAVFIPGAARSVLRTENLRFIIVEESPNGARALAVARFLGARPAALGSDLAGAEGTGPEGEESGGGATRGVQDLPVLDVAETDVFFVTIDAVRSDHVGAYGYERNTTPRIDAFAERAILFERAYTPTPHTSYAIASIFTGKYLRSLVRLGMGLDEQETLADVLRRRGFRTAAFYPNAVFFIDADRFSTLRERRLGFEYVKAGPADAGARTKQVLRYLDRTRAETKPLFLWVHYFEPHEPYEPPADAPALGGRAIDRYDAEIAAVDRALVPLLDRIDRDYSRAVVVVASDHGEEFGEHGGRYHGTTVYDEQTRVPLIIRVPGLPTRRVAEPVELVDLVGTVLALLDVPASPRIRSEDLRPLLIGEADQDARAFTETEDSLAVVDGTGKLVCRTDADACRLFDFERDPRERTGTVPAGRRAAALRRALSVWAASHGRWEERPPGARDEPWPEPLRRALLGDVSAAPEVLPLLRDENVAVRRRAAGALGELGVQGGRDALSAALEDEDPEVREIAALALARLGDRRGLPLLEEGIHAAVAQTRRRAALGLGALGDPRSVPVLVRLLSDESWPLEDRRRAVTALAEMGDPRALPGLVAAIPVLRTRPQVIEALGRLGDRRAVGPLAELLSRDRYAHHKAAAVRALGTIGDQRAVPAIVTAALSREPPPDVVWALLELGMPGAPGRVLLDLAESGPTGWSCDEAGCVPGVSALPLPGDARGGRLFVRVRAAADGGRISILVGGRPVGERPLARGWQEPFFDLAEGGPDSGPPPAIHLRIDPPEAEVRARALLLLDPRTRP